MTFVSVIVTTYNWPEALEACLLSLIDQRDKNFEIIIADDGSNQNTRALIDCFIQSSAIRIHHVFHEDKGFRAGTIRNKAAATASGDYLIFLDGDCTVLPKFITRHRQLIETGYFVPGNRILLNKDFTEFELQQKSYLHRKPFIHFVLSWLQGKINRITPLIYLPLTFFRYYTPMRWEKAMTCNLAMFKSDFLAVNGFDEAFEGWGYEDSDLVIRLIHYGIKRKEGRFAVPVLHHWHKQNDRSQHDQNYQRLLQRLNDPSIVIASLGVNQYIDN